MKTNKKKVQYLGTGRRKKAIARVRLIPGGTGAITINKRDIDVYFGLDTLKLIVRQPFAVTDTQGKSIQDFFYFGKSERDKGITWQS